LDEEILSYLPNVVWHFDEPLADPAALPTYLLSKEVSKHVKVVLSGEGGDEVFGGYDTFNYIDRLERMHNISPVIRKYLLSPLFNSSSFFLKYPKKQISILVSEILNDSDIKESAKKLFYLPFSSNDKKILLPENDINYNTSFDSLIDKGDLHNGILEYYFKEWLPNDLLMKADKMGSAHGLEIRTPFLDKELIQYFFRLDNSEKHRRKLFREVVKEKLPQEILNRRKQGFTLPLSEWFTKPEILARVTPHLQDLKKRGIFNQNAIDNIINNPGNFRNDHRIWVLLNFELWCKLYLDEINIEDVKV
jgi:asparagine synthase (glutamine-hydrolysing)